jgi:deferrochelatase/peroxidase EfeB
MSAPGQPRKGVSRRSLLRGGALTGAGVIGGGVIGGISGNALAASGTANSREPFYGAHQSGIITDTQQHTVLAAFDLTSNDKADLESVLRGWTELGAELVTGSSNTVPIYTSQDTANANAYADATGASTTDDSLESYQLGPQRLTLTVGFGRSRFVDSSDGWRTGCPTR